jgi:transposase
MQSPNSNPLEPSNRRNKTAAVVVSRAAPKVAPKLTALPDDVNALKALIAEFEKLLASQNELIAASTLQAQHKDQELLLLRTVIEQMKLQISVLKRARFGKSSEKRDAEIAQLELIVENLEETVACGEANLAVLPAQPATTGDTPDKTPRVRKTLPDHLPRETTVIEPDAVAVAALNTAGAACTCESCKTGTLRPLGEDVSEMLEYVPGYFKVIRTVRPKYSCSHCQTIVQAPAPSRPLAKGMAGPNLLAKVFISKYCDHSPLYRQAAISEREGVPLSRSTMADWVGSGTALMSPLIEAFRRYVMAATKLHADDTPVPVLQPGRKTTKTGRLWTYVRDDRASGSLEPPAVWFAYSPDRKSEHPRAHLKEFTGILQADAYAGYSAIYEERQSTDKPIVEAACWAHARRKFFDLAKAHQLPIALEAVDRIAHFYAIEKAIRGQSPEERASVRKAKTEPLLIAYKAWLDQALEGLSSKGDLAKAIRYTTTRWKAFTRFVNDGRIEMDNNAAERSIRPIALGKKNYLFAGSDDGGNRAASMYSLIETAKLNGINPQAYLAHVLAHIGEHKINRIEELLPWNVADKIAAWPPIPEPSTAS